MKRNGRLSVNNSGHNIPLDGPLYNKPPIYYTNVEAINLSYITDAEAVQDTLPDGLEPGDPAVATLMFVHYPFSTLGAYYETILGLSCIFNKHPHLYIPYLMVDSDMPLAAGREIWGFAKKLAKITLEKDGDLIIGTMERPKGNRICTGVMRPEKPVPPAPKNEAGNGCLSLRIIPSPDGNPKHSLAELIETPSSSTTHEAFEGKGFVDYNSTSLFDPWHKFTVKEMVSCVYRRYDQVLHPGKIIKKY